MFVYVWNNVRYLNYEYDRGHVIVFAPNLETAVNTACEEWELNMYQGASEELRKETKRLKN